MELDSAGWVVAALCAVMVGVSKTGIPGFGIVFVPLMAIVMPAKQSTGAILGMLILADIFAVGYYRRAAMWGYLIRLIPATLVGIVAGYFVMKIISDAQLKPIIGVIVLGMLAVNWRRNRNGKGDEDVPTQWWFAEVMGFLAGLTTMMANAAGPVMTVYLVAMDVKKEEFIGNMAWFFAVINLFKVPFSVRLGLITPETLRFNLALFPIVLASAVGGYFLLKVISQKFFDISVQALAAASAVYLIAA